jgi:hypothetical protein
VRCDRLLGDRTLCRVFTPKLAAEFFGKNLVAKGESVCYDNYLRAIGTVVARYLHTVDVAGSNPASPIFPKLYLSRITGI